MGDACAKGYGVAFSVFDGARRRLCNVMEPFFKSVVQLYLACVSFPSYLSWFAQEHSQFVHDGMHLHSQFSTGGRRDSLWVLRHLSPGNASVCRRLLRLWSHLVLNVMFGLVQSVEFSEHMGAFSDVF